jgi:hypothetical protein
MQCSLALGNQRFGETHYLHLYVFNPWRWSQFIPPKCWHLYISLRDVFQKNDAVSKKHVALVRYNREEKAHPVVVSFLQSNMFRVSHYTVIKERKWVQSFCCTFATQRSNSREWHIRKNGGTRIPSGLSPAGIANHNDAIVFRRAQCWERHPVAYNLLPRIATKIDRLAQSVKYKGYGDRVILVRLPAVARQPSFKKHSDRLWGPLSLIFNEYRGYSGRGVKLTHSIHCQG